jgi:hypothetical protein
MEVRKIMIGVIDADLLDNGTRHPNLALMKISGYYKGLGHSVNLITDYEDALKYKKIFISKVFTYTNIPEWILKLPNIEIGIKIVCKSYKALIDFESKYKDISKKYFNLKFEDYRGFL